MLRAAIIFFVLGLVAILLGATGFAGVSLEIGRILLVVFLVLAVLSFLGNLQFSLHGQGRLFGESSSGVNLCWPDAECAIVDVCMCMYNNNLSLALLFSLLLLPWRLNASSCAPFPFLSDFTRKSI